STLAPAAPAKVEPVAPSAPLIAVAAPASAAAPATPPAIIKTSSSPEAKPPLKASSKADARAVPPRGTHVAKGKGLKAPDFDHAVATVAAPAPPPPPPPVPAKALGAVTVSGASGRNHVELHSASGHESLLQAGGLSVGVDYKI